MNTEMVNAIADLWKLGLVLFFTLLLIFLREPLRNFFEKTTKLRLRFGERELQMSTEEPEAKPQARSEEEAAPERVVTEPAENILKPEPRSAREWRMQMIGAYMSRNIEEGDEAFQKVQDSTTNAIEKLKNEAFYLWLRFHHAGDTFALAKLEDLAKREEISGNVHYWIGSCYETAGDFEKAARAYEISAEEPQTEKARASDILSVARCLFRAGKQQDAFTRVTQELGKVTAPDAVSALYEGLAQLYEMAEDPELRAFALEKALESRPNDTSLQFSAAHSYGQKDLDVLALLHYNTLLTFSPDNPGALNNISIQYENLQMPMRSVEFYKKAIELGETLAASNLAYRLMNAGFKGEAAEILDKAKEQKNLHANVGSAIAAISDKEQAETDSEESYLTAAREQQRFLLSFAEAYFRPKPDCPTFAGVWRFPDGTDLTMTQEPDQIEAKWVRDETEYKLTGHTSNRAARIKTRGVYKGMRRTSLLGSMIRSDEYSRGYIYLTPDGQNLFLMNLKDQKHSLLTLDKIS